MYTISPMGKGDGFFGPTDYSLLAVLRYDRAHIDRLKAGATRLNPDAQTAWLPDRPDWFPSPLLSAVKRCAGSWCIDGEEYSGTAFLKGGFVTGSFIVPEDGDFLILLLRT